jgi:hypothetical protein
MYLPVQSGTAGLLLLFFYTNSLRFLLQLSSDRAKPPTILMGLTTGEVPRMPPGPLGT